jgi:hypothetical protein
MKKSHNIAFANFWFLKIFDNYWFTGIIISYNIS